MTLLRPMAFVSILFLLTVATCFPQSRDSKSECESPATVILFRPFNFFSFKFSYNLFSRDSLLGRIRTHDVIILETYDKDLFLHTTTKALSLNSKRTKYRKRKSVEYPLTVQQGQVYFVKCDFLNQNLFNYPRQPTLRLVKKAEVSPYMKRRFLKKKIQRYLYEDWIDRKKIL